MIMSGGLHIEIDAFKTLGNWLEGSGWTTAICTAEISTSEVASSFIKVTVAALFVLQNQAYDQSDSWHQEMKLWILQTGASNWNQSNHSSCIGHLCLTLNCIFSLICSLREGNFTEYVESLLSSTLDSVGLQLRSYARWLSVNIRDESSLPVTLPDIYREFLSGGFVAYKTICPFSAMTLD